MLNIKKLLFVLTLVCSISFFAGCEKDDNKAGINLEGKKFANLLFESPEECELFQICSFTNCAQTMEILDKKKATIILTDIIYKVDYDISSDTLIIRSSPETLEFNEDMYFKIIDESTLMYIKNESVWKEYQDSIWENRQN